MFTPLRSIAGGEATGQIERIDKKLKKLRSVLADYGRLMRDAEKDFEAAKIDRGEMLRRMRKYEKKTEKILPRIKRLTLRRSALKEG